MCLVFSLSGIQTIDSTQALFLPIGASVSLLVMFFFFDSVQVVFTICTAGKLASSILKGKNYILMIVQILWCKYYLLCHESQIFFIRLTQSGRKVGIGKVKNFNDSKCLWHLSARQSKGPLQHSGQCILQHWAYSQPKSLAFQCAFKLNHGGSTGKINKS